jgi:hypothetical protein
MAASPAAAPAPSAARMASQEPVPRADLAALAAHPSASDTTGRNTTATAKQDSDNHPAHPDNHQWDGPVTPS